MQPLPGLTQLKGGTKPRAFRSARVSTLVAPLLWQYRANVHTFVCEKVLREFPHPEAKEIIEEQNKGQDLLSPLCCEGTTSAGIAHQVGRLDASLHN